MLWLKKTGEEETQLGSNNFLEADFEQTGRFFVNHSLPNQDMSEIIFNLYIKDVQSSESGEYGCHFPKENVVVFKELIVYVPIKAIKLTSQSKERSDAVGYINNQEATFDEDEIRRFYCYVNGSYPKPNITITAGDEDITTLFDKKTRAVKEGPIEGLQAYTYEVTMSNPGMKMEYTYSGKSLRCHAHVPGLENSSMSIGINIKLAGFKPKFECPQTVIVPPYKKNVTIACLVVAEPPASNFTFFFNRTSGDANITLSGATVHGHYVTRIVPTEKSNVIKMMLNIDCAFEEHFRRYLLTATNTFGTSEYEIELQKDKMAELRSGTDILQPCLSILLLLLFSFLLR